MGKGFGVRDREFDLFFIKTDFFYKLKPQIHSVFFSIMIVNQACNLVDTERQS